MESRLRSMTKNIALKVLPRLSALYQQRNALLSEVSILQKEIAEAKKQKSVLEGLNHRQQKKVEQLEIRFNVVQPLQAILQDNFVEWIRVGVPGWCTASNIEMIDDCIKYLPEGAVIEIGSFCGLSTSIIAHCLRRYHKNNIFYSIDDWFYEGYRPNDLIAGAFTTDDWRQHTEEVFKLAMQLATKSVTHHHIKKNSNDFFAAWQRQQTDKDLIGREVTLGGKIAFAYIDGDHSYQQSKLDFENIDRYLVPGGYVLFDDSAENVSFGSKETVKEVMSHPDYLLISHEDGMTNRCFMKKR